MLVDSHCHLDLIKLDAFEHQFTTLIAQATEHGVEHMLCASIDMQRYPALRERVNGYPQISVSAGVHPTVDDTQAEAFDPADLYRLAQDEKVIAIGESGLDYFHYDGDTDRQRQRFRQHIQVANQVGKPVIVHTRNATEDTLTILEEENAVDCGGIIHCFTESAAFAEQAMAMGLLISISGIITFKNADQLRDIAKTIPDDFLLIETDSPYLAPVPYRGKQNQPAYVRQVAETLAEIRGTTVEHIAAVTRENFYRLFPTAGKAGG